MPKSHLECREGRNWYARNVDKACVVRTAIVVVFLIAAVVCGIFSEREVREMQRRVQDDRYDVSSNRSLANLADFLRIRMQTMTTLAKVAGYCRGNESVWPNSFVPGFYATVEGIHQMVSLDNICFMPMVQPHELPDFETFMYAYFDSEPAVPPGVGEHSFGKGVYALNPGNLSKEYHDTTGIALRYESPNRFLTPILQMLPANDRANVQLTFNAHSSPYVGPYMDSIIDVCIPMLSDIKDTRQCGVITDATEFNRSTQDFHSVILEPVFFGHNHTNEEGRFAGNAS